MFGSISSHPLRRLRAVDEAMVIWFLAPATPIL
jgi:hypothetical protein